MTTVVHPNVLLLERFAKRFPHDLVGVEDLLADNFVWHFFNFRLPDVQGDYVGLQGLQAFFGKLAALTEETFQVEPVSVTPVGEELVVTHVKDRMRWEGNPIELDAVVVWRIVEGRIAEAWDIPSLYT